jgi:signal transduction histidine kinase
MRSRPRSLLGYLALRILLPLSVIVFGLLALRVAAYRQALQTLLIERDEQIAVLAAAYVSDEIDDYQDLLEALARRNALMSGTPQEGADLVSRTPIVLETFNAGLAIADADGQVLVTIPDDATPFGAGVAGQTYFTALRGGLRSTVSDLLADAQTGDPTIFVAAPVLDADSRFRGALLGAIHVRYKSLGREMNQLKVGETGFAYVVDGQGRVVSHPHLEEIGADYRDRPFVQAMLTGGEGGMLWSAPSEEAIIVDFARVADIGWGVVVKEPWELAVAPVQFVDVVMVGTAIVASLTPLFLLWRGVQHIVERLRRLGDHAAQLAAGKRSELETGSPIREINALERAFAEMSTQVHSYRDGLRSYVGVITQSAEDERRRIARELHDETIQNLLAMGRRVELHHASEADPVRLGHLIELQTMILETLDGVRQISHDLRPPLLEDLGLIPALKTLVAKLPGGDANGLLATFEVSGQPAPLSLDQELVLYRISQEALANVRKHARATRVQVQLAFEPNAVRLDIGDDGAGFSVPASMTDLVRRGRFGLMGIQERVWSVGGEMSIQSAPGAGTRVSATLPLNHPPA